MAKAPRLVWDDEKRSQNLAKHGIDFAEFDAFEWDEALEDEHFQEGEWRTRLVGPLGARLVVAITAEISEASVRLISLRAATRQERHDYVEKKTQEA